MLWPDCAISPQFTAMCFHLPHALTSSETSHSSWFWWWFWSDTKLKKRQQEEGQMLISLLRKRMGSQILKLYNEFSVVWSYCLSSTVLSSFGVGVVKMRSGLEVEVWLSVGALQTPTASHSCLLILISQRRSLLKADTWTSRREVEEGDPGHEFCTTHQIKMGHLSLLTN